MRSPDTNNPTLYAQVPMKKVKNILSVDQSEQECMYLPSILAYSCLIQWQITALF